MDENVQTTLKKIENIAFSTVNTIYPMKTNNAKW